MVSGQDGEIYFRLLDSSSICDNPTSFETEHRGEGGSFADAIIDCAASHSR